MSLSVETELVPGFLKESGESFIHSTQPICALATAQGIGALAIVRVSGVNCWRLAEPCLPFLFKRDSSGSVMPPESHRLYYGNLRASDQSVIDEVVVSVFAQGRSFTGEESLEITCHGSEHVVRSVLLRLNELGIRNAHPGEFSFRAYRNGRIDLVQAEAVLSLIHSRNSAGTRSALSQLGGELSLRYRDIENNLNWLGAQIEAQIDFSSEGLDYADDRLFLARLADTRQAVAQLLRSGSAGRLVQGLSAVISGRVNSGKSSLLNAICGFERAIVSNEPGTTRDYIEVEISVDGVGLKLTDTAGLRDSDNAIESKGIRLGQSLRERADVRLELVDFSDPSWVDDLKAFASRMHASSKSSELLSDFFILNKLDLAQSESLREVAVQLARDLGVIDRIAFVSAKSGEGIKELLERLVAPVRTASFEAGAVVTQARQLDELTLVQSSLNRTEEAKKQGLSPELLAFELKPAIEACQRLLGSRLHEQVIDRVFKEFCLGK